MFVFAWLQSFHGIQQCRVCLEEVWPGQHDGGPKLAQGHVEQTTGGTVAIRAEAAVMRVFLRCAEHIGRWNKSERNSFSKAAARKVLEVELINLGVANISHLASSSFFVMSYLQTMTPFSNLG